MQPNMVFNDLGHQAVDRASGADNQMQNCCAALLILNCALDRFDLTTHAPNAIQKLTFLNDCVGHDDTPRRWIG